MKLENIDAAQSLKDMIAQLTVDVIGLILLESIPEGDSIRVSLDGLDDISCEILCSVLGVYVHSRRT